MMSKTQSGSPSPPPPPIHLETIYEESGSSLSSSVVDVHHQSHNGKKSSTQTTHGLISARSIPSVDVQRRRRTNEYQLKPPVEVRHRDGTKHYIHPLLTTTPMIMNRRKYSHSSHHDSSTSSTKINTKYRQILNTTSKTKKQLPNKSEIVLTIITAEDLSQAGITPPSTSSQDESDTLALIKSQSNSSLDTIKTVKDISLNDIDEASIERLPIATVPPSIRPVQPVIDISTSNLHFPPAPRHRSQHQPQLRYPQQISTVRSQSLPPSQPHFLPSNQQKPISNQIPPVAVVPPSQKKSLPSLQITLTSDKNEKKNLSSKVKLPTTKTSSSKSTNDKVNSECKHPLQPSATVLVGGGSRSAFRPFLKSTTVNPQPRIPSNINVRSQIPTNQFIQNPSQQQQQTFPSSHPHLQQFRPTSLSNTTHFTLQSSTTLDPVKYDRRSISSDKSKKSTNSIRSNQILSDKSVNSTSNIKTLNYPQQSTSITAPNIFDNSFNKKNQSQDIKSHSIAIDSNIQWHSVTSKSLYDVPRLSNKYSDIPLRITIPNGTPTHNQKLVYKHDIALEQRLLDAGLSPETIALYERILEVADIRQMDIISPPAIIDQYQHKLLS